MSKRKSFRISVTRKNDVLLTQRFTALDNEELERVLWSVFKTDFDNAVMALNVCGLQVTVHNGNHSKMVCCFDDVSQFVGLWEG